MKSVKKLRIHIALFVLTGMVAAYTLVESSGGATFDKEGAQVALKDTTNISGFTMEKPDGEKTVLYKTARETWMVNNKFPAREQMVRLLIFGLHKLEVKRPVSGVMQEKIYHRLKASGIKVSLHQNNEVKVFYVLPDDSDVNSSYYLQEESREPYIVHVPGIKGEISGLLSLTESDWRSRELFASTPRSLQKVKVSYPGRPDDSFEIFYKNNEFHLAGRDKPEKADSVKLSRYIGAYGFVNVDKYLTHEKDSVMNLLKGKTPFATIMVEDIIDSKSKTIDIYRSPDNGKHYYGFIHREKELVILNPEIVKYLLIKKSYFSGS